MYWLFESEFRINTMHLFYLISFIERYKRHFFAFYIEFIFINHENFHTAKAIQYLIFLIKQWFPEDHLAFFHSLSLYLPE